jgi:hypothetical protein
MFTNTEIYTESYMKKKIESGRKSGMAKKELELILN